MNGVLPNVLKRFFFINGPISISGEKGERGSAGPMGLEGSPGRQGDRGK